MVRKPCIDGFWTITFELALVLIIDLMGGHYRGIIDLLIYTIYVDNFHMRFSIDNML